MAMLKMVSNLNGRDQLLCVSNLNGRDHVGRTDPQRDKGPCIRKALCLVCGRRRVAVV